MRPQQPLGTKRDQIVEDLRRLILSGEIRRGERLRQDALAERFRTSITPVREAFSILESDGLVVSEPHRGVRVAAVDLARVETVYVLRRLAEPYAMRRATVRVSALDIRTAETLVDSIERAGAVPDAEEVRRLNREFHFLFYERCGIPGLADHIASLWTSFPWDVLLGSPERLRASEREHREILRAVRSGDPDAVAASVETHLREGFLAVTARLGGDGTTDPFDDGLG
ncbi:GntR family transcriptional regulator [Streptomyces zingiberis]|uniref:GntR family transcriptional regulator n=1 Tax=Streptomyces zingiberis TaxID=2053010 RepID=A0ABX1BR30_9ACTN|nr:GntR family transcriptional regulator [Streptomyces zingiberis]NJQ00194.1 GntR family transcriptional regulator [Streptomyces zingiberis]